MNFKTVRELGDYDIVWNYKMIYWLILIIWFKLPRFTIGKLEEIINLIFHIFLALQKINTVGTSNADVPLADPGMYQLDITLRRGQSLAARDRGGKNIRTISPGNFFCFCDKGCFPYDCLSLKF